MLQEKELAYRIAFATYRNINYTTALKFEAKQITPELFFTSRATALASISGVKSDFFDESKRAQALEEAQREANFVLSNNIKAIYYTDPEYPQRLRECNDAPAMIFVCGEGCRNYRHVVAMVGTRHCTSYGIEFTRSLVHDLAENFDDIMVVSGMAYGIDVAAHKACLTEGIPTGAIFAHGLNTVYPADHRDTARRVVAEGGFVASEYRSIDQLHRGNFLARNRIVAGLADVTIVVESDKRGGAMSTATTAAAYNREVMAVPGRLYDPSSRGCNELIARGRAAMIRGIDDLIDLTGWQPAPKQGTQTEFEFEIDKEKRAIVEFIRNNPLATVNDMCVALNMPYSQLGSTLFEMEMGDLIVSLPGGRYGVIAKTI